MPRIVSLISSATEIVHALGQIGNLVGRSHECDYPGEVLALPVCTAPRFAVDGSSREIDQLVKATLKNALSVYDVFDDVLERLQPTHILTQTQCEVCAVSLKDVERSVAARLASKPEIVSLQPNSLADVWEDIRRVANSLGIPASGKAVVEALSSKMDCIAGHGRKQSRHPRVACLEWLEPLMAAGNWTPELIEMAGAANLFGESGKHSPWMDWDDLVRADPDVIIAAPCGFDLPRTRSEMYWLTARPGWADLYAVRNRRVYVADGNQYFNRPGPRLVETLQMIAEMAYPETVEPAFQGVGWERLDTTEAGNSHLGSILS
jgi:iron complex transport system substrate-binding protein